MDLFPLRAGYIWRHFRQLPFNDAGDYVESLLEIRLFLLGH
jgi:hypothetical protein